MSCSWCQSPDKSVLIENDSLEGEREIRIWALLHYLQHLALEMTR